MDKQFSPRHGRYRAWLNAMSVLVCLSGIPNIATAQEAAPKAYPRERIERVAPAGSGSEEFRTALSLLDSDKTAAYTRAKRIADPVERRIVQWAAIYFGNGAVPHREVHAFSQEAPAYATAALYKTRLEQALTDSNAGSAEVISLLSGEMPNTLDAQLALAKAYVADGQEERAGRIIKSVWINNFLSADYEQKILNDFSGLLTNADHWQRAVHLLMHDRATGTERIMDKLTPAQRSLALARIAVARETSDARALIDKVDPALRDHPLFHFTRGQDARHRNALSQAVTFLDQASGSDVPDSAEHWYERRLIVRRALAAGDPQTAYAAAAGYKQGPEGRVVEARFHAGWIALNYLNRAQDARDHFLAMRSLSTLPDSITQSNYWLGVALDKLQKPEEARAAFKIASNYNTIYYGQLAREKLGIKGAGLRSMPSAGDAQTAFDQRELVRAIRLLAANNRYREAELLMARLAYDVRSPSEMLLAARLAQEIGAHNLAILIADIADRRGIALDLFNFPKDGLPINAALEEIDKAAVYAVARQESKFDADAVSHSGARGLMQLMPTTAEEVARKQGLSYSLGKLTDPAFNALLGSTYLASQLDRYDGSLILAAAAYNAGAGNVNRWLKTFGDPRAPETDAVNWVETIPFEETRKYVQRVVANYMIYRARLGQDDMTITDVLHRIPH